MDSLANDYTTGIFNSPDVPCLSLYQPTYRSHPDNQQDPIRFRNLVTTIEESLREKYSKRDVRPLLEPFHALASNHDFWNHTLDGLAVLGAPGIFRVYRLQRPVRELAVVAESFHIKPVLRILQSAGRYQILGVTRQEIRLFEGNRDVLDEVELLPAVPRTIDEVGPDLEKPQMAIRTYESGYPGAGVRSGSDPKADAVDNDTERFFRGVDRALLENYSRPSGLPLLLAALPEYHTLFHRISHNPFLMTEGIDIYPDAMSIDELRDRAWRAVEPHYHARLAGLIEMFEVARSRELGSDNLAQIAKGAAAGRVATLLIDADRHVPGHVDDVTGEIKSADPANPHADDVLDDLGELALKNGGQVVIVPTGRMPTQTGIAAIYRF